MSFYSRITEANSISRELNRRIEFYPYVDSINLIPYQEVGFNANDNNLLVQIKVVNKEEGWINFWSLNKFEERLELIRE
jgi:hypothetical protein